MSTPSISRMKKEKGGKMIGIKMTDTDIVEALEQRQGIKYGVMKRGLWYRPGAHGYTDRTNEAWSLTFDEAKAHEYLRDEEPVTVRRLPSPDYLNDRNALQPI